MSDFQPQDPGFATRVRESFRLQRVMRTIGAELMVVEPGHVEIELPFRADLTQQHGFIHAGITTTICDSAAGYAALTLMPANSNVLAVEFKVSLLRPAAGQRFRAVGRVKRAGRRLTVSEMEVYAIDDTGAEKLCLTGLQTSMCLEEESGP